MKIAIMTAASTNRRADWSSADGRSSKILSDGGLIEQSAPKKEAALYRELN